MTDNNDPSSLMAPSVAAIFNRGQAAREKDAAIHQRVKMIVTLLVEDFPDDTEIIQRQLEGAAQGLLSARDRVKRLKREKLREENRKNGANGKVSDH